MPESAESTFDDRQRADREGAGAVRDVPGSDRVETAIRGSGESSGLVVVLDATFTWQLPNLD